MDATVGASHQNEMAPSSFAVFPYRRVQGRAMPVPFTAPPGLPSVLYSFQAFEELKKSFSTLLNTTLKSGCIWQIRLASASRQSFYQGPPVWKCNTGTSLALQIHFKSSDEDDGAHLLDALLDAALQFEFELSISTNP